MKKTSLLLVLVSLICITISCQKDEPLTPELRPQDLVGTWELRFLSGASPEQSGSVEVNKGNEIRFTATAFEKYSNGNLMAKGTYQLVKEKNAYTGSEVGYRLAYKFDQVSNGFDADVKEYVMLLDGRLVVYTSGDQEHYIKIR